MALNIFKPNKNNTGFAFSFNFGLDQKSRWSLYVSSIAQHSWNEQTKSGSFKENAQNPEKKLNTKFDIFEASGLVDALVNKISWKAFHSSDAGNVRINLNAFVPKGQNTVQGFFLNIVKDDNKEFKIPVSLSEARALAIYLETGLQKNFLQNIEDELSRMENARKNNGNSNNRQAPQQNTTPTQPSNDGNPFLESEGADSSSEPEDNPFA